MFQRDMVISTRDRRFRGRKGKPYLDEHREVDRDVNRTLRNDSSMTFFPVLLVVCDFVKGKRFSIHGHHLNIE